MADAPRPNPLLVTAAVLAVLASSHAPVALALDITDCSQSVPDHTVGELVGDITCTGSGGPSLGRRATLRLNGHAIIGSGANGEVGIYCRYACRIEGPGEVRGFGGAGIFIDYDYRGPRELVGLDVHDNDLGILGGVIIGTNLNVHHNEFGMFADRLRASGVSMSSNEETGFSGRRIAGENVTASDNGGIGIDTNRYSIAGLVAQNNGDVGIRAQLPGQGRLVGSLVTGNVAGAGPDLSTERKPHLHDTVCGTSRRIGGGGGTWGVCSAD